LQHFSAFQDFRVMKIMNPDQPFVLQVPQNESRSFLVQMKNTTEPVEYDREWDDFPSATPSDLQQHQLVETYSAHFQHLRKVLSGFCATHEALTARLRPCYAINFDVEIGCRRSHVNY
jgi:nitric oxide reductase activation protein